MYGSFTITFPNNDKIKEETKMAMIERIFARTDRIRNRRYGRKRTVFGRLDRIRRRKSRIYSYSRRY